MAKYYAEIVGEVLGNDLHRIFINFSRVSFNMLIHQMST